MMVCACSRGAPSLDEAREKMISQQIVWQGITNPKVIETMKTVPREEFVLPQYRDRAYEDLEVPIGEDQTLDRPYEDALMLDAMGLVPTDRILEVGTGAGYVAALISRLAKEVYTIEILEPLATTARERLKRLGYTNITVRHGDGFIGWKEAAPFDAMILTCSPDHVPTPLIEQLKEGGRIVLPLGGEERFQEILLYVKKDGKLILAKRLTAATFVPMEGKIKQP
ncbi:MAG: protein-L-isoaspartate(D-aspartate) O-methyltransferase [Deltaproteobacteria bacterium]|nr:protein-L-isoaspartate(D-aspartate) O-methyltransferase [Deltaproteobacteria bacterium]